MKPSGTILPSSFFLLFIILFINEAGGALPPLSQSTTITHQAHSFDDMGEWRQLIAKGSNFIKVDLRYALPHICIKQPRVLNFDARGCYLLTHDAPLATQPYYTSHDIVAFVIDPENQYLFPNSSKFYLYLDFKNNRDRYPPANLTQSDSIQKEYISFFTNQLRARNWTHVELVYNGVYLDEKGKAYPWPRTYAFQTEDINLQTSCLYSYKGQCRNKTIINNMANPLPFVDPSLSIYRMCEVSFGKFTSSQYPMVFYEPTDQKTIVGLLDTYLECGYEHKPGFSVSINIDPIHYDVYAGTRSGKAWNERLYKDAKWAHAVPISSNGSYVSFVTLYLTREDRIFYSFARGAMDVNTSSNGTGYKSFPFGKIETEEPRHLIAGFPFSASAYQKLKTFTFSVSQSKHPFMFVSDSRGVSGIYAIEEFSLRPVVAFTLAHAQSATIAFVKSSIITDKEEEESELGWIQIDFLQGFSSFQHSACSFFIQWWRIRFDPSGNSLPDLSQIGNPTCGVYSPSRIPVPVESASLAISPVSPLSSDSLLVCPGSSHSGLFIVSSHKNIYGGVACVNVSTQTIKICTDLTCTLSQQQLKEINDISSPSAPSYESSSENTHDDEFLPPTLADLDVGTFPSLSLSSLPSGEIVVLEVHGDGFCYNSDWNNKKATPTVCNITAISSRYVLNYNYGKLTEWASHIFEQRETKITSCDGAIYHGTYDEGSLPSAFLIMDKQKKMKMVEAHTGFPTGAIDYAGCSWPVSFDGAMIDGITLPDLSKMIGGKWQPSKELMAIVTPSNNYEYSVYSPTGEITLATSICNMCKERFFKWQLKYQADYELMQKLTLQFSEMCAFGQLFVGDGTVTGCKNLILLYMPALAVDMARNIFSPDNCLLMGLCQGNASSILPDINSQVARSIDYTNVKDEETYYNDEEEEEDAEFISSDLPTELNENKADAITQTIRKVIKAEMLKLLLGV